MQSEKANLQILFDKYVPICLDTLRVRFKKITPVPDITMVTTLCYLLECLLNPTNTPPDCNKELYELYFVFAAVWAFGGAMFQDQVCVIVGNVNFLLKYLGIDPVEENIKDLLCTLAGADLGGGCRGCATPPEMTCGFLIQLVFCKKTKNYVVYWC